MDRLLTTTALGLALAILPFMPVTAQDDAANGEQATAAENGTSSPNPYARPNDSWISISGRVVQPTFDSFTLDYGDGTVIVEMDDWDPDRDARGLMDGDKVTVYGEIDDDLFELTTIEASSVYVENLNTYFYASSADEEEAVTWILTTPIAVGEVTVRGSVLETDPMAETFTLDTGLRELTIDTAELDYNPLDDLGYQQIARGDRVSVVGDIDRSFIEEQRLDARSIITLDDADADDQAMREEGTAEQG